MSIPIVYITGAMVEEVVRQPLDLVYSCLYSYSCCPTAVGLPLVYLDYLDALYSNKKVNSRHAYMIVYILLIACVLYSK